jgi:agmatine deiminase
MITDSQTNYLYLADCLPASHPLFYAEMCTKMHEAGIAHELLSGTRDIWAVDYMPVQVSATEYVQFRYYPDYLRTKKWERTITDTTQVCNSLGLSPMRSNIIVDGGNVVRSADTVIMCDKVFRENPDVPERILIKQLQELLGVDRMVFIPQDRYDFTGHADGIVRFLDADTVLINSDTGDDPHFNTALRMSLHNAGLNYIEVPYVPDNTSNDSAIGLYLNYLQMENVIMLPVFGMKEDEEAVRQFETLFPRSTIIPLMCNDIARKGGVLNCISWNVKKDL